MKKISVLALTIGMLATLTSPASAAPISWDTGAGDWFILGNWNPASVPTNMDDAFIVNGGTATANSATVQANDLNIGLRNFGILPVSGTLNTINADVNLGRDLSVGVTDAGPGLTGFSTGTMTTTGGASADGDVTVGRDMSVGYFISGPIGTANGNVDIQTGDLTGTGAGSLRVGEIDGNGSADGTLSVNGTVSGFATAFIGLASIFFSTGSATGNVDIQTGDFTGLGTGSLSVGAAIGVGTADGTLSVDGNVSGFLSTNVGTASNSGDGTGRLTVGGTYQGGALRVGRSSADGPADGMAEIGGGISNVDSIIVGNSSNFAFVAGSATGALTVFSGGIQGTGGAGSFFSVGSVSDLAAATGTAMVTGGVSGFEDVDVGTNTNMTGTAAGNVDIQTGGLTGTGAGSLKVGWTDANGTADGTLTVNGTVSGFETGSIGTVSVSSMGNATGNVDIQTGDYTGLGTGGLSVGVAGGNGTADGTLSVAGNVSSFNSTNVGTTLSSGNGTGKLTIGGTYQGGALIVGRSIAGGAAHGMAEIGSGISNVVSISVGNAGSGANSNAVGSLTLVDGSLSTEFLTVGVSTGTSTATGRLDLNDNLAVVSDTMMLGDGSTIALGLDGFMRGIDFGAIDADVAILDGILELNFSFQPIMGMFDLIVSGSPTGITGDFDAVNFFGLNPGTLATFEIVMDMGVEIYRLEIGAGNPIPDPPIPTISEPGTLVILVSGLMVLGMARRRRR